MFIDVFIYQYLRNAASDSERSARVLAPLTDSILVEAAHQPQFPCPKVSRKTS